MIINVTKLITQMRSNTLCRDKGKREVEAGEEEREVGKLKAQN